MSTLVIMPIPDDLLNRMKKVSDRLLAQEEQWQGRHTLYLLLEIGLENFTDVRRATRHDLIAEGVMSTDTSAEDVMGSQMLESYGYEFQEENDDGSKATT